MEHDTILRLSRAPCIVIRNRVVLHDLCIVSRNYPLQLDAVRGLRIWIETWALPRWWRLKWKLNRRSYGSEHQEFVEFFGRSNP